MPKSKGNFRAERNRAVCASVLSMGDAVRNQIRLKTPSRAHRLVRGTASSFVDKIAPATAGSAPVDYERLCGGKLADRHANDVLTLSQKCPPNNKKSAVHLLRPAERRRQSARTANFQFYFWRKKIRHEFRQLPGFVTTGRFWNACVRNFSELSGRFYKVKTINNLISPSKPPAKPDQCCSNSGKTVRKGRNNNRNCSRQNDTRRAKSHYRNIRFWRRIRERPLMSTAKSGADSEGQMKSTRSTAH